LDRFHWVLTDRLAAMSLPGRVALLEDDLAKIRGMGVRAIATLTEEPLDAGAVGKSGLAVRHFPIDDFDIPTIPQTADFCRWVDERMAAGDPVAVHCFAGLGRTGTMIGCLLVRDRGATAEGVLKTIRRIEPGFVQTAQQEAFIAVWESEFKRQR
jgi:atypical dual specificity phosphatase